MLQVTLNYNVNLATLHYSIKIKQSKRSIAIFKIFGKTIQINKYSDNVLDSSFATVLLASSSSQFESLFNR